MNYSSEPNYYDLIVDTYRAAKWYYRDDNWRGYSFPSGFVSEFQRLFVFPLSDAYPIVFIAVLFTLVRYLFEYLICKVSKHTHTHTQKENIFFMIRCLF